MTLSGAFQILLWLVMFCLVFGVFWWLTIKFATEMGPTLVKIAQVVIIILALAVLVYAVFGMFGEPTLPRLR